MAPGSGHQTPTYHHHLLSTHSPYLPSSPSANGGAVAADLTPLGTNALGAFAAALPTTHLSLHAPEFNMQQPPSTTRTAIPNKSLATPAPSSSSAPSAAAASQTSSSKGQIHVKLIQARGLNVRMMHARPYVVVQFEQNEFVSRDPTNETDKEVKGTATNLSRNGSSNALSVLGAIGSKAAALDASRRGKSSANSSPASSVSSGKSSIGSTVAVGGFSNGLFGRLSAHNPVWKHEVSL